MVTNTGLKVIFNTTNPDAAEFLCKITGTKTIRKQTNKYSGVFVKHDTGDASIREAEVFNIHPNQLKTLKIGEAVIIQTKPQLRHALVKVPYFQPTPRPSFPNQLGSYTKLTKTLITESPS